MAGGVNVQKRKSPVFSGAAASKPNKDFPVASGAKLKVVAPQKAGAMVAVEKKPKATFVPQPDSGLKPFSASKGYNDFAVANYKKAKAMPKATGSESAGMPRKPAPSSNYSGTSAAPASSTSDTKFVSQSSSPPAYQAPVAGVKRGGVETRYQRDGLAMDQRRK